MGVASKLTESVRTAARFNFAEALWFWHKAALALVPLMMLFVMHEGGDGSEPFIAKSIIAASCMSGMFATLTALAYYFWRVNGGGRVRTFGTPEGSRIRHQTLPIVLRFFLAAIIVASVPHQLFFAVRQGTWFVLERFAHAQSNLPYTAIYHANNGLHYWFLEITFLPLILVWDYFVHWLVSRPFRWKGVAV